MTEQQQQTNEQQAERRRHPAELHDPYPSRDYKVSDGHTIRISQDIDKFDVQRIRMCMMDTGYLQIAIKIFIKHLAEYVRRNNYSLDNRDDLIAHINTFADIGGGLQLAQSAGLPDGERPNRDDGRGAGDVREGDTGPENKSVTEPGKRTRKTHQAGEGAK